MSVLYACFCVLTFSLKYDCLLTDKWKLINTFYAISSMRTSEKRLFVKSWVVVCQFKVRLHSHGSELM